MKAVQIALAVAAAFLVQTLGGRYFWPIRSYVDAFLLTAAAFGLMDGRIVGLTAGTVAGLVQDAFSGGLLGLNGLSKTTVGYLSGIAGRRLILRGWPGRFLFFVAASVADLLMVAVIAQAVGKSAVFGEGTRPAYECLTNGFVGMLLMGVVDRWRRSR